MSGAGIEPMPRPSMAAALVGGFGALLHLLHGAVDLLLRALHGLLAFLQLLLLERSGGGRGAGGFDAAAGEGRGGDDGEKCLHGWQYRRKAPPAMPITAQAGAGEG